MVAISSWHWRPRRRPVLVLVAVSVGQKELTNVFPGLGAGFLSLGGKTEGTAKNGKLPGVPWVAQSIICPFATLTCGNRTLFLRLPHDSGTHTSLVLIQ